MKLLESMMQLKEIDNKEKFLEKYPKPSIYNYLAYYLCQIRKYCNFNFFKEYMLLILMLIRVLQEEGYKFLKGKKKIMVKDFCSETHTQVISEIMNLFIAEKFPKYFKEIMNLL